MVQGEDLTTKSHRELEDIRGSQIGMIPQDPMTSLKSAAHGRAAGGRDLPNYHRACRTRGALRRLSIEVLRARWAFRRRGSRVELSAPVQRRHAPARVHRHERRRLLELLIADEPTTALDVTIRLQILDLLAEIQQRPACRSSSSRDLHTVAKFCDDVMIMYAGRVVE